MHTCTTIFPYSVSNADRTEGTTAATGIRFGVVTYRGGSKNLDFSINFVVSGPRGWYLRALRCFSIFCLFSGGQRNVYIG